MSISDAIEIRPRWSLRLLGEFELVELDAGRKIPVPGKRERALLAYLAVHPKCREARLKLTTFLWGEESDETTLDNLRTCVFNLRKALGSFGNQVVSSEGRDIALDSSAFDVDVVDFLQTSTEADVSNLQRSVQFYGGAFLDGLSIESDVFESWRRDEATRYSNRALEVLNALMEKAAAAGDFERAIDAGQRILRIEPLHEPAIRRLMLLYRDSGRRSAAVELYRSFADRLERELGAQPEPQTRSVFAEIGSSAVPPAPGIAYAVTAPAAKPDTISSSSAPALTHSVPRRRRGIALLAAGVLAAAMVVFYATGGFLHSPFAAGRPASSPATIEIAVLPFGNASGGPEDELFYGGLTQEITAALAKIPGLRVIGRDSVSQFKLQPADAAAIGKKLGAAYVVRGSVQTSGQRLLIAASLIGSDGKIVWTQNYERRITDVFALQGQLAQAIATALHLPFQSRAPALNAAIDPDSYQQYLAARPLVRARYVAVQQGIDILEPLVARYPDFAPASALLGSAYVYASLAPGQSGVLWPKAETAARRAIASDPSLADGYFALARLQHLRGKLVEADDLLRKALSLDAGNSDALNLQMALFADVGRLKDALAIAERLHVLEPAVPAFNADFGRILWENGRNNEAIDVLKPVLEFGASRPALAMIYSSMGRYKDAAGVLEHDGLELSRRQSIQAARILRAAPAKAPAADTDPPLYSRPFPVDFVYLYTGYPERALGSFEQVVKMGGPVIFGDLPGLMWHPSYAPARKTERFKRLMRDIGNVDYWRVKGWPEFCQPTTGDDFTCH